MITLVEMISIWKALIITLLSVSDVYSAAPNTVPSREISGLEFLYNSTNGQDWLWRGPVGQWDFSGSVNPCDPLWQGVTCDCSSTCTIVNLELSEYDLDGTIPPQISWLPNLTAFDFSVNRLHHTIPDSIGDLSKMSLIDLHENEMTGTIPEEIQSLSSILAQLDLSANLFGGNFSAALCELTVLANFNVLRTRMSGSIPSCINKMSSLTFLDMGSNKYTGELPDELGGIPSLEYIRMAYNRFRGSLPSTVCSLQSLTYLDFSVNDITGTVPWVPYNVNSSSLLC